MTIENKTALEYILVRPSKPKREVGDVELMIDYGSLRIEIWKVVKPRIYLCGLSVEIKRYGFGLKCGPYKTIGILQKEAL